jgi:hypothetical protein
VFLLRLYPGPPIGLEIPYEIAVHTLVRQYGLLLVELTMRLAAYGIATTVVSTFHPTVRVPSPLADIAVAAFGIACVVTFSEGTARIRRWMVIALVLMLASYAIIVAGRVPYYAPTPDVMDGTRYHYVATMAIALAVSLILSAAGRRLATASRWPAALVCVWLVALIAARLRNGDPPDHTQFARGETASVLRSIDEAIEAAPPGEDVHIPANDFPVMAPFFKAHTFFPGWAGVFVVFYFLEPQYRAVRLAAAGRRSAGLLVFKPPDLRDKPGEKP